MSDLEQQVIDVVSGVIEGRGHKGIQITLDSGLNNPAAWDSLAFVEIFMAIAAHFSVEVSDDDAIYFMTAREIVDFLRERI